MDSLMYVKVLSSLLNIVVLLNIAKEDIIIPHVCDAFERVVLSLLN